MRLGLRKAVRDLAPYAGGETGEASVIQLGWNESGFPPSARAVAAAHLAASRGRSYGDQDHGVLRAALARRHGLDPGRIVCGAGSMEIMAQLVHCFLEPGRALVMGRYGYRFPMTLATAAGAEVVLVDERSFTHDVDEFLGAVTGHTAVVYVANPNNPTGTALSFPHVRRLADQLPDDVLLMLDCAYAEYAAGDYASGETLVDEGYNVAVLRTFSKIHGLAGMRIGWAYAPEDVVEAVRKIRAQGSIATPSLAAATASLDDAGHARDVRERTVALRRRFAARLAELGFEPEPSEANFLLAGLPDSLPMDAEDLYREVRSRGILLRRLANFGLQRHLRITIGSPEDMRALDGVLTEILARRR